MVLKLISIIIPTRNEERNIFNTVRGLQGLRKEKLCEIILVDGMSVDKTVNIATQYVDKIIMDFLLLTIRVETETGYSWNLCPLDTPYPPLL